MCPGAQARRKTRHDEITATKTTTKRGELIGLGFLFFYFLFLLFFLPLFFGAGREREERNGARGEALIRVACCVYRKKHETKQKYI